jgi:hypothetical protein
LFIAKKHHFDYEIFHRHLYSIQNLNSLNGFIKKLNGRVFFLHFAPGSARHTTASKPLRFSGYRLHAVQHVLATFPSGMPRIRFGTQSTSYLQ